MDALLLVFLLKVMRVMEIQHCGIWREMFMKLL